MECCLGDLECDFDTAYLDLDSGEAVKSLAVID